MDTLAYVPSRPQSGAELRNLLPEAEFSAPGRIEVTHAEWRLDRVGPGALFLAFDPDPESCEPLVELAASRGAVAVLTEHPIADSPLPVVRVRDLRAAHARVAERLEGDPCREVRVHALALSGTNDPGPAALMARSILHAAGRRAGAVHELGWFDGLRVYPAPFAEPTGPERSGMIAQMRDRGATDAVMAFSDQALERRDGDGLCLESVVVAPRAGNSTTTRQDARELARLVRRLAPGGRLILPANDPALEILSGTCLHASITTFGLGCAADLAVWVEGFEGGTTLLRLIGLEGGIEVRVPRIGGGTVSAAAAAAALGFALGIEPSAIRLGLESIDAESQEFAARPSAMLPRFPIVPAMWADQMRRRA